MKNNDYHNLLLNNLSDSYKIWFAEEKKYLEKHITPNSKVLEVGAGDGRSILDLVPITKNIVGIDHDEAAVLVAQERFSEYPTIQFVKAEAETLPFKGESFDFVICMTSFANFADKRIKILEEMKRVLKTEGEIIISIFSEKALPERLQAYKDLNVPIKEVKNGTVIFDESLGDNVSEQFSRQELLDIFIKAGLKVKDITEVNIAYLCALSK